MFLKKRLGNDNEPEYDLLIQTVAGRTGDPGVHAVSRVEVV